MGKGVRTSPLVRLSVLGFWFARLPLLSGLNGRRLTTAVECSLRTRAFVKGQSREL